MCPMPDLTADDAKRLRELCAAYERGDWLPLNAYADAYDGLRAALDTIDRLRAEQSPPLSTNQDSTVTCDGCGHERTEPHAWRECHAVMDEKRGDAVEAWAEASAEANRLHAELAEARAEVERLRADVDNAADGELWSKGRDYG